MDIVQNDIIVPIKRKKGRPRKSNEKKENVIEVVHEKKKRGRKKKERPVEEPKPKKKRGRKAAVKYFSSSIRKKIPLTTMLEDNESHILHIDIENTENVEEMEKFSIQSAEQLIKEYKEIKENLESENKLLEHFLTHDDKIDEEIEETIIKQNKFDESEIDVVNNLFENRLCIRQKQDDIILETLEHIRKNELPVEKIPTIIHKQDDKRKIGYFNVLNEFFESDEWLNQTNICCWWCCHTFSTIPIGFPIKYLYKPKKFRTKGIFCSFPCMIAFSKDQHHENRDLIQFLFYKLTGSKMFKTNLIPAPPKCSLKMFGGELEIDEFRESVPNQKIYNMIEYPMVISRDYIEEVDLQKVKSVNNVVFNSTDLSRIKLSEKQIEDAQNRISEKQKNTITSGNTIDKFLKNF